MMEESADVVVIGAGLVGLATAYRYLERRKNDSVLLIEKDDRVACQQSTHNSGVLHAGLYYRPGSEKARLCVQGLSQMVQFCRHHQLPHDLRKVVVATTQESCPAWTPCRTAATGTACAACAGSPQANCARSSPKPPGWARSSCRRRASSTTAPSPIRSPPRSSCAAAGWRCPPGSSAHAAKAIACAF